MFLSGQKVVCVNAVFPLGIESLYTSFPVEGETYTIRDIIPGVNIVGEEGEVALYLIEIRNPENKHGIERGYNAERFAPLQTTEEVEDETVFEPIAEPAYT